MADEFKHDIGFVSYPKNIYGVNARFTADYLRGKSIERISINIKRSKAPINVQTLFIFLSTVGKINELTFIDFTGHEVSISMINQINPNHIKITNATHVCYDDIWRSPEVQIGFALPAYEILENGNSEVFEHFEYSIVPI